MKITKKENKIDDWTLIEITKFNDEDVHEIERDQLGFWLSRAEIERIWWKNNTFFYFNVGATSEIDTMRNRIIIFAIIDNVLMTKGKYKKFVEIDNETYETVFVDSYKMTTEKNHIPVFALPNDIVDLIVESIDEVKT